jgi:purine-nucleoside phosphorylase
MQKGFPERVKAAAESVRRKSAYEPRTGVILGSGLTELADDLTDTHVHFSEIDEFPDATVQGHRGILGLSPTRAVMAGRFHFYEGHSLDTVVLPVFMLRSLGVETIILTNAAGGINPGYAAGEIVLIRDHINLLGSNPLIGPNDDTLGTRFPDMSEVYSARLRTLVKTATGQDLLEGVYAAMTGPSYETPAEIRMLQAIGADLVGMSTVPEAICARYLGMEILGFSTVTNPAAGLGEGELSHTEVVKTGKRIQARLEGILKTVLHSLEKE